MEDLPCSMPIHRMPHSSNRPSKAILRSLHHNEDEYDTEQNQIHGHEQNHKVIHSLFQQHHLLDRLLPTWCCHRNLSVAVSLGQFLHRKTGKASYTEDRHKSQSCQVLYLHLQWNPYLHHQWILLLYQMMNRSYQPSWRNASRSALSRGRPCNCQESGVHLWFSLPAQSTASISLPAPQHRSFCNLLISTDSNR